MNYTPDQWLLFFFIYCFIGWIWESGFVSIRTKKLTNRGFMRGPFIPIYGCGCVLMMAVGAPLMDRPVLMYFAGMICASVMEFITGDMMLRLFKVRYWDYSDRFLNIKGHICLAASLLWGVFTLLMNYLGKPPIERQIMMIPQQTAHTIVIVLVIYFTADFSLSFKTALDLRDVIIAMEAFKEEIERMQKRMDVAIAFADDTRQQAKDALNDKIEESKEQARLHLEERLDELQKRMEYASLRLSEVDKGLEHKKEESVRLIQNRKQELLDQIEEYRLNTELMRRRFAESAKRRGALYRNMIRNNILVSDRFGESLEDIKRKVEEYTEHKGKD